MLRKFIFISLFYVAVLSAATNNSTTESPQLVATTYRSRYSLRRSTTKSPLANTTTSTILNLTTLNITTTQIPIEEITCGESTDNNHPWIAILEHTNPDNARSKKTLSKGVLISSRFVLTTVSSIHHSHAFWIVSGVRLGDPITFGSNQLNTTNGTSPTIRIEIDEVYLHPRKDIAIIKLSEAVNFTKSIQPVCLPTSGNYNFRELFLHVCKRQGKLKKINFSSVLPIAPQDCTTLFHRQNSDFGTEEFCAWDEANDDCAGDLGGPLNANVNGKYHVLGLNSFTNFKDETNIVGLPGVYTRVWGYIKWINLIINSTDIL